MTIFTWRPQQGRDADRGNTDEFLSDFYAPDPVCFMCGEYLRRGDVAWAWLSSVKTFAHAECIKKGAPGLIADIAKAMQS